MLGNWFKTTLLMAGIVALFGVVGAAIGGMNGLIFALLLAAGMNFYFTKPVSPSALFERLVSLGQGTDAAKGASTTAPGRRPRTGT